MPRTKKEPKKIYEDIYAKQVHEFMETYDHIIKEEDNIFKMAKSVEERYDFVILTAKQQIMDEINNIKTRNTEFYERLITEHKNHLVDDFHNLKLDIELTLEEHKVKVDVQMKLLGDIYTKNKKKLLSEGLKELGFGL